jgi:hypothetical protein
VTRSSWLTGGLLAGLFLALHLPFLPPSLEDLDSINFALGIRDYDVSRHQPHPPGYPLFILAAKGLHAAGLSELHALSLLGVVGGSLAIFGCLMLFGHLDRDRPDGPFAWMAVLLVAACPLYWVTAARPLSDALGLAAALAVQGLTLSASSSGGLVIAAALAGFVAGLRSQIVWLTLPLLAFTLTRLPRDTRMRGLITAAGAYVVGALVWAIPLVVVSGGPRAYWQTFFNQGAEDLTGVAMLATTHTVSLLIRTLQAKLVAPWGYWQTATAVIALGGVGFVHMLVRARSGLLTLLVAFGPYLIFDLLFQEAITTRYALPLVVPASYLAIRGLSPLPRAGGMAVALGIVAASIFVDDSTLYGYAQMPAPAFRMLGDMYGGVVAGGDSRPVLAMHRKDEFDMRRPMQWAGSQLPTFAAHLPAPPKHEWLELVKYWNGGGRQPVWFVADPLRSDLALLRTPDRPVLYRWPFRFTSLVGGVRPNEMDWHVIEPPDWYLGEGWALTPETAGVAAEDQRGPGYAPVHAWIRRPSQPLTLLIGGRNLAPGGPPASLRAAIDGVAIADAALEEAVPSGFFLRILTVPPLPGAGGYANLTVASDNQQLALEQFDAEPAGHVVFGFGEGWNELEYNPATGALWRWSSDRATIRVRAEGHAVALTLRGEIEAASSSHVVVRAGGVVAAEFDVGPTFSKTVLIPAASLPGPENVITIESSAWYVPAEKRWRSRDRRRLGLKVYECQVTPVS